MSFKLHDLSREQMERLLQTMKCAQLLHQNPYIASGPRMKCSPF